MQSAAPSIAGPTDGAVAERPTSPSLFAPDDLVSVSPTYRVDPYVPDHGQYPTTDNGEIVYSCCKESPSFGHDREACPLLAVTS